MERPGFVMELPIAADPEMQFISTEQTERWVTLLPFAPTAEPAALPGHVVHIRTAWRTTLKLRKFSTKKINLFSMLISFFNIYLIDYFTRENKQSCSSEQPPPLGLK